MELTLRATDIDTSGPIILMNSDDCLKLGVDVNDRVKLTGESSVIAEVAISDTVTVPGSGMVSSGMLRRCGSTVGGKIRVEYCPLPESVRSIRAKIEGRTLNADELKAIVSDIMDGLLTDTEIIAFVSAFNVNNASMSEIASLTRAMADTGSYVDFGIDEIYDFHSLGGVPGNKITPIVVSIVAAEGFTIPKLSSRAVSSACGTADYVNTFCDVEMDHEKLKAAVQRTKGLFACGNDDYAPVGKMIIKAERPMGIDPRPTMLASIMSKKLALNSKYLIIDIPTGKGSKIPDLETAEAFAHDLIALGKELGIRVECAVTRADQPIGRCIGPILEAKECISVLENGDGHPSVIDKACAIAGLLLEMGGLSDGEKVARESIASGKAWRKFKEIVVSQNGSECITSSNLTPGVFTMDIHAKRTGYVQFIDNPSIVAMAKAAGAPFDVGAGVELLHKVGDHVIEGETLFTIYAENQAKLDRAVDSARSRRPMLVSEGAVPSADSNVIINSIRN